MKKFVGKFIEIPKTIFGIGFKDKFNRQALGVGKLIIVDFLIFWPGEKIFGQNT